MIELLSKFEAGEIIGLAAVIGGCICGLAAIVMGIWLELRKAEIAGKLKQDMLERNMSAEDIRVVLEAGTADSGKQRSCSTK